MTVERLVRKRGSSPAMTIERWCTNSESRWSVSGSHSLRHLAQLEFLDLAGAGFRNLGEHDVARAFVRGEVLAAPLHQLLVARLRTRLELDEGAWRLAPFVVVLGNHRGGCDGGVLVERILHLDRGNVLAAGDDDVLGAVLQLD